MGYDTSLMVDDRILLLWRKHASSLPRLLFRHDQLVTTPRDDDHSGVVRVTYEATVEQVLQNLDDAGLGWSATIAAYAEIRIGGTVSGMVWADGYVSGDSPEQREERVRAFDSLPPEVDLTALGNVLAHQLLDHEANDDLLLFAEISYDGSITSPSTTSFDVYKAAELSDLPESFAAARAAESWSYLYMDAPLLAWPILICILLHQLPRDVQVVLDLTDDAYETADIATAEDAREYAASYWASSSTHLARVAETYGRLFGVLASFDNKLGHHFWLARAADLHARLIALSKAPNESSARARGDILENLVEALLRAEEPELLIVEKNFRTREEEVDILVANGLSDPFWMAFHSPLIMIECKNWKSLPGVAELRVLESKIKDRRAICSVGIFVSVSGFPQTVLDRLKSFQADGGVIFAINGDDLAELIRTRTRLTSWLRGKGLVRALGQQRPRG